MINDTGMQALQQRGRRLGKALIALLVIVAAQVVALEMVVRGWQGWEAMTVFGGMAASGLLCALAVIIFFLTRRRVKA
jgi:hypothetical protein